MADAKNREKPHVERDAAPVPMMSGGDTAGVRTMGENPVIDVVIPVYNAAADVARCVASVLAHTDRAYRLVLIDDASPDPAIAACFAELERRALSHVVLLRNERNQGFTGTANRGLRLSRADVVLLNSDTVVTKGWLSALARCAEAGPHIGTATPFSNNAEICSFPRFCEDNVWRDDDDLETVREALVRAAVPTYPSLPTGVGFCFYIRRALIDAIGAFDPAFGPGYGEENDFSMRALAAGYHSVLCDDAFVLHQGGRSFAGQKADLGARNLPLLLERHPRYLEIVREFIARDPLRPLRDAALSQYRVMTGPARGVLHVIHGHGGGTEHHVRALIDASRERYRHYVAVAAGEHWELEEHLDDGALRTFKFQRLIDESWEAFLGGIAATFGIDLVHLHNLSRCRDGIITALANSNLPYGYTVHDLGFACPTITFLAADGMYCGGETDADVCTRCLAAQPAFRDIDIVAWRARHRHFLARSAFIIAPSEWAASMLTRYFPGHAIEIVPHGAPFESGATLPGVLRAGQTPVALPEDDVPTVAVLGAVGPDKGARRLERMVELVRRRGMRVRFVVIGYLDKEYGPWQSDDASLTIHGAYDSRDLADLLLRYRVKLVAFPSACPETFSFTLSEAWAAGRPVVVPPFGALAERVAAGDAGWSWTDAEWRSEESMLARIADILAPANAEAFSAAAERARAMPRQTLANMAERTVALYDASCAAERVLHAAPFPAVRVRDALGYVPWSPPCLAPPASPLPISAAARRAGLGARVAGAALGLRHSFAGRALYRLTPAVVREALKRRLS